MLYREDALALTCNMVKVSNHPYALALREVCGDKRLEGIDLNTCKEEVGVGVICGEYVLRRSTIWPTLLATSVLEPTAFYAHTHLLFACV